ncbi:MAG: hypothetical protein E6R04_04890 [Spirochaetes bacterium]|nr:MAG: hypothetical protein E6R04_04890 [Spirochaetota bacterium]
MSEASVNIAFGLVLKFFGGDLGRAYYWWHADNPNLGGVSPGEMVRLGREDKLLKWVKQQVKDSRRE